ncbi:glycosyltransferase [Mucilaginibacter ginkgonis]|uniref:Glycosyltransferase family 2 protein n=1 Tax=Mucilaginibacter ginkgonis TaxID=2682091 RepID=A0A6I4HVM9_9SPHI|nr:glycosyltransferase [Mucilaginibacter ginkgonis]QQL50958.1 glycosyltransferase family 2 protein [Mucilaginibacter ginkgonis]
MKVSVIVVNHKGSKLSPYALTALSAAADKVESEIIVIGETKNSKAEPIVRYFKSYVDNISQDINFGIANSIGEYILILQPDAVLQYDAIKRSVQFMDHHQHAGGLSVRMLDADGNYLQSSKKVLPDSWIAFFKLTGLLKQFPKSRLRHNFAAHHEDEFDTIEMDVLGSSFMLLRRSALDTVGKFDERFGKYGSNIDISYRLRLAGFKNYYFPKTYIIKEQAQAVTKFSWQYLKGFYGALFIFVIKYFFSLPAVKVKPLQELYPAYELKG